MRAPVRVHRMRSQVSIGVLDAHRARSQLDATLQAPRQANARALHGRRRSRLIDYSPGHPPRFAVVWELDSGPRARSGIATRVDSWHHLVPPPRASVDEACG